MLLIGIWITFALRFKGKISKTHIPTTTNQQSLIQKSTSMNMQNLHSLTILFFDSSENLTSKKSRRYSKSDSWCFYQTIKPCSLQPNTVVKDLLFGGFNRYHCLPVAAKSPEKTSKTFLVVNSGHLSQFRSIPSGICLSAVSNFWTIGAE